MEGMTKRDDYQFAPTADNRALITSILKTAIDISDASIQLGFARHITDLARTQTVNARKSQLLPDQTHNVVNDEVRAAAFTAQQQAHEERPEIRRNAAGRVLSEIQTEIVVPGGVWIKSVQELAGAGGDPAHSAPQDARGEPIARPTGRRVRPAIAETIDGDRHKLTALRAGPTSDDCEEISRFLTRRLRHSNLASNTADARVDHRYLMSVIARHVGSTEFIRRKLSDTQRFIDGLRRSQQVNKPRLEIFLVPGATPSDLKGFNPYAWRAIHGAPW